MSFFGKVYKLESTENFEEFVNSLNLPEEKAEAYINAKSSQKIEQDGDEYVITTFYEGKDIVEMRFKNGVEFDEAFSERSAKNTIIVDGNRVVQTQKFADGHVITYDREYSPEQLVLTLTTNLWPGTAKRIYVAE